jgi:hypothetical protein
MNPDLHQLDETFSAHEVLAPDADSVLAKSHEIARHLKRRQWAVRATGSGVLAAGLIAGGLVIPHALQHSSHNAVLQEGSDTGVASPKDATPTPTVASSADDPLTAFFNAGYTYADAQQLAQLWHESSGPDAIGNVKTEAGQKLIKGQTLPIPPSGTPASPQDIALQAFWNAGYDYTDAQTLATMWHETDLLQVKTEAGTKLESGQTLPIQPSGGVGLMPVDNAETDAVNAFFAAGYTYGDAVQLAQTWNTADPYHAKIEGGQKLEQGQTLPIPPSGTPASDTQNAIAAFFAAGYDYADAQELATMWHETDTNQVKAEAGQKLENGQSLPIAP